MFGDQNFRLELYYAIHQNANWNLRILVYDTVPNQMYQPSLIKVHKQ